MNKKPPQAFLLTMFLIFWAWPAGAADPPPQALLESSVGGNIARLEERRADCVRGFDDQGLVDLMAAAVPLLQENPRDPGIPLLLAKGYLARCDLRRFKRKTYDLERKENSDLREQQDALAQEGLAYAEEAIRLDGSSSEAHRVMGELFVHRITGPIAGFRFGPRGKTYIEKAIELDSTNWEANRALGLMYLYNPPFNGGDKKKAAETFDEAIRSGGDDRACVLAARAYIELKNKKSARDRLDRALRVNPKNLEAKELLGQLE